MVNICTIFIIIIIIIINNNIIIMVIIIMVIIIIIIILLLLTITIILPVAIKVKEVTFRVGQHWKTATTTATVDMHGVKE